VISAKYGYFYYNTEDRGLPRGIRYVYGSDLITNVTKSPVDQSILVPTGSPNVSFAHANGFASMTNNQTTEWDIFSRKTFVTDGSYSVSKWGQHNFKVGYGLNRLYNNVFQARNTALVNLFWGILMFPPFLAVQLAHPSSRPTESAQVLQVISPSRMESTRMGLPPAITTASMDRTPGLSAMV